ncbi:MAG: hypothetical protein QN144_13710 [Armatimonadota bacterium]|nr:hypothetical protein [Armatimonadota bacterium]
MWALGSDYDVELIRQSVLRFNKALRQLAIQRGMHRYRARQAVAVKHKEPEDAISDLVGSLRPWYEQLRRVLSRQEIGSEARRERELTRLLVPTKTKPAMLDTYLDAVKRATPQHFSQARELLINPLAQLLIGLTAGYDLRRKLAASGPVEWSEDEETALKLLRKYLKTFPVFVAYYVYLASNRPSHLKRLASELDIAKLVEQAVGGERAAGSATAEHEPAIPPPGRAAAEPAFGLCTASIRL